MNERKNGSLLKKKLIAANKRRRLSVSDVVNDKDDDSDGLDYGNN